MRTESLIFYSILDKLFKTRKDKPKNALHFSLVFWNTEKKKKTIKNLYLKKWCKKHCKASYLSAINRITFMHICIIKNDYRTEYDLQLSVIFSVYSNYLL